MRMSTYATPTYVTSTFTTEALLSTAVLSDYYSGLMAHTVTAYSWWVVSTTSMNAKATTTNTDYSYYITAVKLA